MNLPSVTNDACHIRFLSNKNDVIAAWLMKEKPFKNSDGNTLPLLFSAVGITTAKEAAKMLDGIASESTVYEWWKRPAPISWKKLDQVFWRMALSCKDNSKQWRGLTAMVGIVAEREAGNDACELTRNMWQEELTEIAGSLDMQSLATLVDVARALELSQKATLAAIEDGAKPVPFSGRLA